MDVIIPESEETTFFTKDYNEENNNSNFQVEEMKSNDDDNNNVDDLLYEYGDVDVQRRSSDQLQGSRADTSRRRINVVATSTSNHNNQNHKTTTATNTTGTGTTNGIVKRLHQTIHRNRTTNSYDISFHPNKVVLLYIPPRQRQKWGEPQILPRVNWGDLFFDLFYVAATYNVSTIITDQPNSLGLLYTAGTFLPIMNVWASKTQYDARYVGGDSNDDIIHRCIVLLGFTGTGILISNIRTVTILSNPSQYISMFLFTTILVTERILCTLLFIEIYFCGVGQRTAIMASSATEFIYANIALPFYTTAMILSGIKFFGNNNDNSTDRLLLLSSRFMAAADTSSSSYETDTASTTNIPIILCLIGYIIQMLSRTINIVFCLPKHGRHKEVTIPINVDFVLHRNGEWMMLILGKSIFSLLIVSVVSENRGYEFYFVFYCSILIVILLQLLHYQTQPHHADEHAARRSKNRGMIWSLLQSVYSLALVIMGATYTFFLLFSAADHDTDKYRRLQHRVLAGTAVEESDRIGAAHLFSGALAIVLFLLNIMDLLHMNVDEIETQCLMKSGNKFVAILLATAKIGIVIVAATISQWTINQKWITMTGLILIVAELVVRKLSSVYLSRQKHTVEDGVAPSITEQHKSNPPKDNDDDEDDGNHDDEEEEATWPNVMHARIAHVERD